MKRAPLLALALLAGCTALPWPQSRVPGGEAAGPVGWLDLRGTVHVHTEDSHDSPGKLEDVVAAARDAGLSWVALTEHTRPGGPAKHGVFDDVVVIPGYEIRAWGGSMLLLGVGQLPERVHDPVDVIREVHAAGGVAFVSHFEESHVAAGDWAAARPDGVEIMNLHATAVESGIAQLATLGMFMPPAVSLRSLMSIPEGNLEHWESLPGADAIVAGSDAHANVRLLGPLGGTVNSYDRMFRLATTHVLARSRSQDAILEALRVGRSYTAFEGRGRVDHFRFEQRANHFVLEAPRIATLVLICDGQEAGRSRSESAALGISPGAKRCRGEAWLGTSPWIFTSYQRVS